MAASLSTYWVKFFKGAGFPQDVATKHAVVFSNNRIKPDMLPDLDKPSLKEMGIMLMGDMIAILRYAKKVVEETTCERFLVDSEDTVLSSNMTSKPASKKIILKVPSKPVISTKVKPESLDNIKPIKNSTSTVTKSTVVKKKTIPSTTRVISHYIDKEKAQATLKRKIEQNVDQFHVESDEEWNSKKKLKPAESDNVGYKVILPKGTTVKTQQILKKALEQKRTVFDRLGDSSVTSTTNLAESNTTFNITGIGKEVLKRNSSVFNRLGDKDAKKEQLPYAGILKNGTITSPSQGILKNESARTGATILKTKKVLKTVPKSAGTMRADQEKKQKSLSNNMKHLIRTTRNINFDKETGTPNVVRKVATSSKLASERIGSVPAKARLGIAASTAKQVTFNKITTVAHLKKPGVFSRLGV
ncbi:uncharacterized protein C19orf47 isoform X1 [Cephus cinctus]|uniref:Uncharacterized protein C19orf47 isoform X1 n=1 Tax=Cephus cinctus TaxID=211228 RepID=A0AAJ7C9Y7_CEPCN|nr:uncharacterized protein C19orf47 isoform X1 [Cephus cinctus]